MPETETQVQTPLLRTKLHRPPGPADVVHRGRLHERMDLGLQTPLTLVSAPAGYGKSMLVSHWADSLPHGCAWLSLDSAESDLRQFLAYLVAAIEGVFAGSCKETTTLLETAHLPPIAVLVGSLSNELDALEGPLPGAGPRRLSPHRAVVTGSRRHHPSPRTSSSALHLILVTRRDPPLRLMTLRAGSRVTELRLPDLRFTVSESAELLEATLGLAIDEDALANLEREVEGWAAGLRLVSLSLRHLEDPSSFIKSLQGGLS